MAPRRERIRRTLSRRGGYRLGRPPFVTARRLGGVVVDFSSLELPGDVASALAEAFWQHYGPRQRHTAVDCWFRVQVFARFVRETRAVRRLADIDAGLLAHYIEWLAAQRTGNGPRWSKWTRSATYGTLRKLLQWLARCRPGLLTPIEYPSNPFPFRNREGSHRPKVSPDRIRALLRACEEDIERRRHELACADNERSSYPGVDAILPYYLAILIHTAGNAWAIAQLCCDCLQALPLLEDRELLVWRKPRAASLQRRSFRRTAPFEPPVLVREIIEWTRTLRPRAQVADRDQLFLVQTTRGVRRLSDIVLFQALREFEARHDLTRTAPSSIRPSVLTALYRSTGDLLKVKAVANHARPSTTVGYVETPEVEALNRTRIATLQRAFLGHIERAAQATASDDKRGSAQAGGAAFSVPTTVPSRPAVSMFGFDCLDPLAGIAPGTRAGELCSNFLACFSCPNAVIPPDAGTLARLLQARDHLKGSMADLHPARWQVIYAPALRILEEDILTRFAAAELGEAAKRLAELAPLPPLR